MEKASPMVSVVLPCYNHEKYIEEAIDSVMNQTYQDFELIITDDGSTDRSRELIQNKIEQYGHDPRIRFYPNDENTCFLNIENAFACARGKYIASISGDDMMMPEKLKRQVDFLEQNADRYKSCFTWVKCIGDDDHKKQFFEQLFNRPGIASTDLLRQMLLHGNCLNAASYMIRTDVYRKLGGQSFAYRQLQDYDLWLRYLLHEELYVIQEPLTCYRVVAGSVSDAASSPDQQIRDMVEHENIIFEVMSAMDEPVLDRLFPDPDPTHHTETDCCCRKIKVMLDHMEENALFGMVALRLFYQYRTVEGFIEALEKYGISRRKMHAYAAERSSYAYAVRAERQVSLLLDANQKHRFLSEHLDKTNMQMVEEILDMTDAGTGELTVDHIVALYDYCKAANSEDDFVGLINEMKAKGVRLFP